MTGTPKTSRKRTPRKTNESTVPVSQVIVSFAKKRNLSDTTKAGKILRSSMRSNYDHLQKTFAYPGDKENRDGNRWPNMPASLAKVIAETGKVPSAKQ